MRTRAINCAVTHTQLVFTVHTYRSIHRSAQIDSAVVDRSLFNYRSDNTRTTTCRANLCLKLGLSIYLADSFLPLEPAGDLTRDGMACRWGRGLYASTGTPAEPYVDWIHRVKPWIRNLVDLRPMRHDYVPN